VGLGGHYNLSAGQLIKRLPAKKHNAPDRSAAAYGKVGKEIVVIMPAGVLDGGDNAYIQIASGRQSVQMGRRAGHDIERMGHNPGFQGIIEGKNIQISDPA
jgi:hypothetical protein